MGKDKDVGTTEQPRVDGGEEELLLKQQELELRRRELDLKARELADREAALRKVEDDRAEEARKADEEAKRKMAAMEAEAAEAARLSETVTVIFHNTDGVGGDQPVRLFAQGRDVRLRREEPVELKKMFLESADNAIRDILIQNPQTGRTEKRAQRRYPYTIVH